MAKLGSDLRLGDAAQHPPQIVAIDKLYMPMPSRRLDGCLGELSAGDHDGAGCALIDHDPQQLMDIVVRHLVGVPMLHLDQYIFASPPELEIDATVKPGIGGAGSRVFDV